MKFFSIDGSNTTLPTQSQLVTVHPWSTVVSLTFDDATLSQYTLAYPDALAPHQMTGTFMCRPVKSTSNGNHADHMTWAQIASLASVGNEVGGHTIDHVNLTQISTQDAMYQVCQGRQDLFAHGYSASSFAYPEGATNASVEQIVEDCGYTTARKTGGLSATNKNFPFAERSPRPMPSRPERSLRPIPDRSR